MSHILVYNGVYKCLKSYPVMISCLKKRQINNMKTEQLIAFGIGIIIVMLLAGYGVFSAIIGGFASSFGEGFGILLGILFCLIIVLAVFGVKGSRR